MWRERARWRHTSSSGARSPGGWAGARAPPTTTWPRWCTAWSGPGASGLSGKKIFKKILVVIYPPPVEEYVHSCIDIDSRTAVFPDNRIYLFMIDNANIECTFFIEDVYLCLVSSCPLPLFCLIRKRHERDPESREREASAGERSSESGENTARKLSRRNPISRSIRRWEYWSPGWKVGSGDCDAECRYCGNLVARHYWQPHHAGADFLEKVRSEINSFNIEEEVCLVDQLIDHNNFDSTLNN